MWKKIITLLIILLSFLLSYGLYIFIKNNNTTSKIEINYDDSIITNKDDVENKEKNKADNENLYETRAFHITKEDCDNECLDFKDNLKGLHYCQNFCGILRVRERSTEEVCEDLDNGLPRDYCFRDKAISARDMNICTYINDRGVKEHCKNRITEDIIDESF